MIIEIEEEEYDLDEELDIDLDGYTQKQIDGLPGLLVYMGKIKGALEEIALVLDAAFRRWRGQQYIANHERLKAEWKVKALMESEPDFVRHKKKSASVENYLERVKALMKAIELKTQIYQSRTGWKRTERSN